MSIKLFLRSLTVCIKNGSVLFLLLVVCADAGDVQNRASSKFRKLPKPEKWWVLRHPFIAKEAHEISVKAQNIADDMVSSSELDGDKNGGQVDAFRHTLWMAMLSREFGKGPALSLGRAHEHANYAYFLQHRLEDGAVPDREMCEMDLRNNAVGVALGRKYRHGPDSLLIELVKETILSGECWVIKKDPVGHYLDSNNSVIDLSTIARQWETPKFLVRSNESRK